jgi:hypothetical protein
MGNILLIIRMLIEKHPTNGHAVALGLRRAGGLRGPAVGGHPGHAVGLNLMHIK